MRYSLLRFVGISYLITTFAFIISCYVTPRILKDKFSRTGTAIEVEGAYQFALKRKYLESLSGKKIVLIGDSFILGESLYPVIGATWREQTLDKKLNQCLSVKVSDNKTLENKTGLDFHIVNFGLNGLLPEDIAKLMPAFSSADLVVFNINNRSFAADFNATETRNSRDWIADLNVENSNLWHKNSATLLLLKRYSFLETPQDWGRRLSQAFLKLFGPIMEKSERLSEGVLLLKLKSRYSSASYDTGKYVQAAALSTLLQRPESLAFRTVEDKSLFNSVASSDTQIRLNQEFNQLIRAAGVEDKILPSPINLTPDDYIDLVHVTPSGYDKYAQALCDGIFQKWTELK